jgi:putative flippase GtrA
MTATFNLKRRLSYYTVIGSTAALVHLLSVFILVHYGHFHALLANIFAFFIAFNVSFFGHKYLTFSQLQDKKTLKLPYFFMVATSACALNEGLYFLVLHFTQLNYMMALCLVLVMVSMYSFILSRYWACR